MLSVVIVVLVIIGVYFVASYLTNLNSAEKKGIRGELHIANVLTELSDDYYIINNVIYRTEKGTTQLDHIVVSKYGVFPIETKNYRGEIYGDDKRNEWTQIITTDVTFRRNPFKTYTYFTKNHFYNPVSQSLGHTLKIKELLSDYPNLKIVPIVVFTRSAILHNVESKQHVIYEKELVAVINKYKTIYLTDKDVQRVLSILLQNDISRIIDNDEHVRNIYAAEHDKQVTINSGNCPKCGGKLVLRRGKYGYFYGCSNYPSCKFTLPFR